MTADIPFTLKSTRTEIRRHSTVGHRITATREACVLALQAAFGGAQSKLGRVDAFCTIAVPGRSPRSGHGALIGPHRDIPSVSTEASGRLVLSMNGHCLAPKVPPLP